MIHLPDFAQKFKIFYCQVNIMIYKKHKKEKGKTAKNI